MKILKMLVLALLFAINAAPCREADNTISFMFAWPNPDPCGGEECVGTTEQGVDV
jgi:hypothetical protein